MKTLQQLRAELGEKVAALQNLQQKAFGAEATDEDVAAFKSALDDVERIDRQIEDMERAEALTAKASKLATAPVAGIGHNSGAVPATVKEAKPEDVLSLTAAALVKSRVVNSAPLEILEKDGYGRLASELGAAQTKAVNTLVSAEGGILVPQAQVGGIVPLLRQDATFLAAGPTRITLVNGQYKVARGASGATAAYVGESALKPVSTPTFDGIDMRSKKLAGIVPLTKEAQMWTIGDIAAYVRDDLRASLALTMDLNMWLGTGAGSSPVGILNKAGVQTLVPTFTNPQAPTLQELDRFASQMILRLTSAGLLASGRWRWVMSFRTAMYLQDMRVGANDGAAAFPGMQGVGSGATLTWKGFPVVVTSQLPTNGGANTDETTIALVDFAHVLFGEEEDIVMRQSDQASLDLDGTGANIVHLWQQNMFALLAESMHDVALRFSNAVVKATGIRF